MMSVRKEAELHALKCGQCWATFRLQITQCKENKQVACKHVATGTGDKINKSTKSILRNKYIALKVQIPKHSAAVPPCSSLYHYERAINNYIKLC